MPSSYLLPAGFPGICYLLGFPQGCVRSLLEHSMAILYEKFVLPLLDISAQLNVHLSITLLTTIPRD